MTDERRYSEDEVAAIFQRATEAQQSARRQLPAGQGMTLADLREIGREVGVPAELVDRAAHSLDHQGQPTARTFLALPIGVGQTIDLGRRLSEAEWERLVVDLRETFDAMGTVRSEGSFRQWTNGNLQALLEPTPTGGHRLRLRTLSGAARGRMMVGLGMLGVSAATLLAALLTSGFGDPAAWSGIATLGAAGLAIFGLGAARLPAWARLRRRQMEGVAARLALAAQSPAPDATPTADDQTR